MTDIHHPTAVIHPASRIGSGVTVGPYAIIEDGVELGDGVIIGSHAIVRAGSVLGEGCVIDSQAVIGGLPQDLRFDPRTPSGVRLGKRVRVREGVTINRATQEGVFTEVGDEVFLMAYAHVAHDCVVGDHAILANNVMLAGFVTIGAHAFLGGGAAFHQHVRIGESVMVSGMSRCANDVGPFCMVAERDDLIGLNLVGLKRRGLSRESIKAIKLAFSKLFREPGNLRKRATELMQTPLSEVEEARRFLAFFETGKRGFARPSRYESISPEEGDESGA